MQTRGQDKMWIERGIRKLSVDTFDTHILRNHMDIKDEVIAFLISKGCIVDHDENTDIVDIITPEKDVCWDFTIPQINKLKTIQLNAVSTNGIPFEQLEAPVIAVLQAGPLGKGRDHRAYLTSYQVFQALPTDIKAALEDTYGGSGLGCGGYSAAQRVAQVLLRLVLDGKAEQALISTEGIRITVNMKDITPGYPVCSLFRVID